MPGSPRLIGTHGRWDADAGEVASRQPSGRCHASQRNHDYAGESKLDRPRHARQATTLLSGGSSQSKTRSPSTGCARPAVARVRAWLTFENGRMAWAVAPVWSSHTPDGYPSGGNGARARKEVRRSVVGESDPGKSFDRGQGSRSLRRHEGPAPIGIGIHDGTTGGGHSEGPITDARDTRHRRRPGGVGDLPGEHCCGLMRKDRDAGIARTTGVLTDDPTARRRGRIRATVGASERSICLSQRRAGRSARRHSCSGRDGRGGRAPWWCGGRRGR
jgi:hypothetical protein